MSLIHHFSLRFGSVPAGCVLGKGLRHNPPASFPFFHNPGSLETARVEETTPSILSGAFNLDFVSVVARGGCCCCCFGFLCF